MYIAKMLIRKRATTYIHLICLIYFVSVLKLKQQLKLSLNYNTFDMSRSAFYTFRATFLFNDLMIMNVKPAHINRNRLSSFYGLNYMNTHSQSAHNP